MRHGIVFLGFALMLAATTGRADILPEPDRGPAAGSAAGLDFMVEWVSVEWAPVNGPHYQKRQQVVVLTGCTDGQPNCTLARSRNLIGMEVQAVDGEGLRPEKGMVQQILDAFASKTAAPTVTLELFSRGSNGAAIEAAFARR